MSQIIQVNIGQAGNRISHQFWNQIRKQHGLDQLGQLKNSQQVKTCKISSFFQQQQNQVYKPRSISVDINDDSMQYLMRSNLSNIYQLQNCIYNHNVNSSNNLWPAAYNACKGQFLQDIMDCIRSNVEPCDHFGGIKLIYSNSGGSGSGISSAIMQKIQFQYTKFTNTQVGVIPSPNISNTIIEPYNATLNLNTVSGLTCQPCILFDNQAYFRILNQKKQRKYKTFYQVNQIMANSLSDLTAPFRFPCDGNVTFSKLSRNLIIYPRLKFMNMSLPFQHQTSSNIYQIIHQNVLNLENASLSFNKSYKKDQKWLVNYFVFRGPDWKPFDSNYQLAKFASKKIRERYRLGCFKDRYYKKQFTHNFIATSLSQYSRNNSNSVSSVQINSGISNILKQIYQKLCKIMQKKAYLHLYMSQGMQIEQINEAQMSLNDTINQYAQTIYVSDGCYQQGGQHHE